MKQEALLKIILRDIQELELLVTTFLEEETISDGYIQLAKSKTQAVLDELELISQIKKVANKSTEDKKEPLTVTVREPEPEPEETKATAKDEEVIKKEEEASTQTIEEETSVSDPEIKEEADIKSEIKPTTEIPSQSKTEQKEKVPHNAVLGEVLGKDNKSLNEQLSSKNSVPDSSFQNPITDLKKAIGINDRFYFQRELFNNNTDLYNQVVDQINALQDFDAALSFIKTNFNWDFEYEATESFIELVKRRFIN